MCRLLQVKCSNQVAEEVMELQTKSLEVTTSVLDKIDIPVERVEKNIPTI
jgi:hypothetical protein